MYSPPHEFSINIPQVMGEVRMASYRRWSWPSILAKCFANWKLGLTLAISSTSFVVILSLLWTQPGKLFTIHSGPGAFYQVIPYPAMVLPGIILFLYVVAIWIRGGVRFWSEAGPLMHKQGQGWNRAAWLQACGDALRLNYLKGGGPGCFYPKSDQSSARRIYHTLTFWGFLSDFASTVVAAVYQDFFHWWPPYSIYSAPVILGSVGVVMLVVGTSGLIWCKMQSDTRPAESVTLRADYLFLVNLQLTALSGTLVLGFRGTSALGSLLILHLALVATLLVSAPYGKFVHFVYRFLAIVRNRMEQGSLTNRRM
jgi:citrate/tricarballylate utilization protein